MRRFIPLALLLGLGLSACTIRFDVGMVINEDESGIFTLFMGFDEEFQQLAEQSGDEGLNLTQDLQDVPEGWEVAEVTEDGFEGIRISTEFNSLDELEQRLAELNENTDTGIGTGFLSDLELTHTSNEFRFKADVSGLSDEISQSVGDTGGGEDPFSGIDTESLFGDLFEISFKLTLPGEIIENNADEVDGNTLTWNVEPSDEGNTYEAVSVAGSALLRYVEQIDLYLSINDDESGVLSLQLGLDDDAQQLANQGGGTASDFIEDIPGGWDVLDLGEDGFKGVRFSTDMSSIGRVDSLLSRLGDATGLNIGTDLLSNFELDREGSGYRFSADVSDFDENLAAVFDTAGVEARFTLTLPGDIGDHNADEINTDALIWDVAVSNGGNALEAISSTGGTPVVLIAFVAAAAIAAALGVTLVRRSRNRNAAPLQPSDPTWVETRPGQTTRESPTDAGVSSDGSAALNVPPHVLAADQPEPAAHEMCPHCGAETGGGQQFCSQCGRRIEDET